MARLVPAKPKIDDKHFKSLVAELERDLDDTFIVFQKPLKEQAVIIGAPDKPWVVLAFIGDVVGIDPDSEEIVCASDRIDPERLLLQIRASAEAIGVQNPKVIGVISSDDFELDEEGAELEGLSLYSSAKGVVSFLTTVSGDLSVEGINDILQGLSKLASEYKPGTVTKSQAAWREEHYGAPDEDGFVEEVVVPEEAITSPKRVLATGENITLNKTSAQRVQYVESLIKACVANITKDKPIFASGVEVDPEFLAAADGMLPVLLIAASDRWAPVVSKAKGVGGFDIRLARDPQALLGMRIIDILASSPFMLFMPIANVFHQTGVGVEFNADEIVAVFHRWVEKYQFEDTRIEDIDINIALKSIEG